MSIIHFFDLISPDKARFRKKEMTVCYVSFDFDNASHNKHEINLGNTFGLIIFSTFYVFHYFNSLHLCYLFLGVPCH